MGEIKDLLANACEWVEHGLNLKDPVKLAVMSILSSLVHAISIFQSCCTARLVREKMNLPKEHGIRVRGGLVLLDKKHNNFRVGLNRVGLSRPKNQHLPSPTIHSNGSAESPAVDVTVRDSCEKAVSAQM